MPTEQPTHLQVLACQIRAEREAYEDKHKKPYRGGGFTVPLREDIYKHLSTKFGLPVENISYFFTYTRHCTHKWSEGACHKCPVPAIGV